MPPLYFIGDSQTSRMLKHNFRKQDNIVNWSFPGATTAKIFESLKRCREDSRRIPKRAIAIVWVGTNDVLRGGTDFISDFKKMLKYLKKIFNKFVIILLPPLLKHPDRSDQICFINKWLASHGSPKICTLDLFHYCQLNDIININLYEQVMGKNKRVDKIHLNRATLHHISSMLGRITSQIWKSW